MAYLNAAARKAVPADETAVPQKRTASGGAVSGSYPIPDISHARNALARSSGKPVAGQVRDAVDRKFPQLAKPDAISRARKR